MKKYYAICYADSQYLAKCNVLYVVFQSKFAHRTPSKSIWQKELNRLGSCPRIAKVMRADRAEKMYNIAGDYAFAKK